MEAEATPSSIRAGYDRWALVYDHGGNPLTALEEPVVRAALGDVRGRTVLDLGCGTGRRAEWLAAAGARVTARHPRAEKYVGWPILLVRRLRAPGPA